MQPTFTFQRWNPRLGALRIASHAILGPAVHAAGPLRRAHRSPRSISSPRPLDERTSNASSPRGLPLDHVVGGKPPTASSPYPILSGSRTYGAVSNGSARVQTAMPSKMGSIPVGLGRFSARGVNRHAPARTRSVFHSRQTLFRSRPTGVSGSSPHRVEVVPRTGEAEENRLCLELLQCQPTQGNLASLRPAIPRRDPRRTLRTTWRPAGPPMLVERRRRPRGDPEGRCAVKTADSGICEVHRSSPPRYMYAASGALVTRS